MKLFFTYSILGSPVHTELSKYKVNKYLELLIIVILYNH